MEYENILVQIEDGIAELTLNRPSVLNALDLGLIRDVRDALARLGDDPSVRALVMTGAGRGFCSGADLAPKPSEEPAGPTTDAMKTEFNPMMHEFHTFPAPVVTAVNGVAAGGGVGMALSGDLVFAARSATFIQVFAPRLGLIPDLGCTWFLPRLVGRGRASGLALLGDRLPAAKAEEWGLIWKCVDDEVLMEEARGAARRLAAGPTQALVAVRQALDASVHNDFEAQLAYEHEAQGARLRSAEYREGVSAFLSKREPNFSGT